VLMQMHTRKCFAPQIPSRFDRGSGLWVPTINMAPAREHGELIELLPPEASRMSIAPLMAALRERMDNEFNDGDYMIAVGDPSIIAAACIIAARKSGGIMRILRWDRQTSSYMLVEARP